MGRIRIVASRKDAVEADLKVPVAEGAGMIVRNPNNMQPVASRVRRHARVHKPPTLVRHGTRLVKLEQIDQSPMLNFTVVHKRTHVNIMPDRRGNHLNDRRAFPYGLNSNDGWICHETWKQ